MKNIVLAIAFASVLFAIGCTESKPAVTKQTELPPAPAGKQPGQGIVANVDVDGV